MKIGRMNRGSWGKIRAFFDLETDEGFVIKGFKLVEGMNGLFVGYPSQKGTDDEYHDQVFPLNDDLKNELGALATNEYNNPQDDTMFEVSEKNNKKVVSEIKADDIPF